MYVIQPHSTPYIYKVQTFFLFELFYLDFCWSLLAFKMAMEWELMRLVNDCNDRYISGKSSDLLDPMLEIVEPHSLDNSLRNNNPNHGNSIFVSHVEGAISIETKTTRLLHYPPDQSECTIESRFMGAIEEIRIKPRLWINCNGSIKIGCHNQRDVFYFEISTHDNMQPHPYNTDPGARRLDDMSLYYGVNNLCKPLKAVGLDHFTPIHLKANMVAGYMEVLIKNKVVGYVSKETMHIEDGTDQWYISQHLEARDYWSWFVNVSNIPLFGKQRYDGFDTAHNMARDGRLDVNITRVIPEVPTLTLQALCKAHPQIYGRDKSPLLPVKAAIQGWDQKARKTEVMWGYTVPEVSPHKYQLATYMGPTLFKPRAQEDRYMWKTDNQIWKFIANPWV